MTFGSLFAGIGGFDLGLERAGLSCAWQVEKDAHCLTVLGHHWPDVPRLGDVCLAGRKTLPKVDVVCGGFPCQDLSVAGKRAGLKGERSGLFYEMARVVDELKPAYLLWENVPGLLTSGSGRDFLAVLVELDRIGYSGAWTSLNARWFGLAQQRLRVFGLFARGRAGAVRCSEILALAARRRGHPPQGGEEGPRVAATLRSRSHGPGVNPPGRGGEDDANLVAVAPCETRRYGKGTDSYASDSLVAHCLRSEGADAGEDGTGRGTPLVCVAVQEDGQNGVTVRDAVGTLRSDAPGHQPGGSLVAFNWQSGGDNRINPREGLTDALSVGQVPAVAFAQNQRDELRLIGEDGSVAGALSSQPGMKQQTCIAFQERGRKDGPNLEYQEDVAYSLNAPAGGGRRQELNISVGMSVRRLTPRECERLQGFLDDWTAGLSDSARYRVIGNAVAVPVAEWIGRRIMDAVSDHPGTSPGAGGRG